MEKHHAQNIGALAFHEVTAQLRGRSETSACFIFEATQHALGLGEEQCGVEILDAVCLLVRQGMVACSTHDCASGAIRIAGSTMLSPLFPTLQ